MQPIQNVSGLNLLTALITIYVFVIDQKVWKQNDAAGIKSYPINCFCSCWKISQIVPVGKYAAAPRLVAHP